MDVFKANADVEQCGVLDGATVRINEMAAAKVLAFASIASYPVPTGPTDFAVTTAQLADSRRPRPCTLQAVPDGMDAVFIEALYVGPDVQAIPLFANLANDDVTANEQAQGDQLVDRDVHPAVTDIHADAVGKDSTAHQAREFQGRIPGASAHSLCQLFERSRGEGDIGSPHPTSLERPIAANSPWQ